MPPASKVRPRLFRIQWPLLAFLVFSAGCGGTTEPEQGATEIRVVSGDGQSAVVTRTLPEPVTVRLLREGRPVDGGQVRWSVRDEGCGTVASSVTRADEDGFTRNSWTLGETAFTTLQDDCELWVAPAADFEAGQLVSARALAGPVARNRYESGLIVKGKVYPEVYTFPGGWLADEYGNPQPFVARLVFGPLFVLDTVPGLRGARSMKAFVGPIDPGPVGSLVDTAAVELVLDDTVVAVVDVDILRAEGPGELKMFGVFR